MENQTAEIAIADPLKPELRQMVNNTKIELTKAEGHAMAFMPSLQKLAELSRPLADLDKVNPTAEHAKIARETRLAIVKVRTGGDTIEDSRKANLILEANFVKSNNTYLGSACKLTEAEYLEIEKHSENLEKIRKQELAETRIKLLEPFEVETMFLPLSEMTEDQFQIILSKGKEAFNAIAEARKQASIRILAEEKEAEEKRLAELEEKRIADEKTKAEREAEDKRIREENEALRKANELAAIEVKRVADLAAEENKKRDVELQKEREENARLAKIEADKAAAKLAQERAEMAKFLEAEKAENARLKEIQDKQDFLDQQEKQRIEAEEAEKLAKEKAALNAPDVEKLRSVYTHFNSYNFPEMTTDAGKEAVTDLRIRLQDFIEIIIAKANGLKAK